MPTKMHNLTQLASRDVVVHSFFSLWQRGDYASFEAMLVDLCVALASEKQKLMEELLEIHKWSTRPVVTPAQPKGQ